MKRKVVLEIKWTRNEVEPGSYGLADDCSDQDLTLAVLGELLDDFEGACAAWADIADDEFIDAKVSESV